jgi:arginyl-tRNA synthetase
MDELMEEIDEAAGRSGAGRDALRFFFLSRSANSNIEFDIELAKKKSLDNPVFYVQYGSARIHSILNKARELSKTTPVPDPFARNLSLSELASLTHPDELAIVRTLSDFPSIVRQAALAREPHKIATYVSDLARAFQSYYTRAKNEDDPVLPKASTMATPQWETTWDFKKTAARLEWLKALRNVYVASLSLLGVSAPEEMHRSETDMDGGLVPAPQRRSTS